jgi:hypothetical protein
MPKGSLAQSVVSVLTSCQGHRGAVTTSSTPTRVRKNRPYDASRSRSRYRVPYPKERPQAPVMRGCGRGTRAGKREWTESRSCTPTVWRRCLKFLNLSRQFTVLRRDSVAAARRSADVAGRRARAPGTLGCEREQGNESIMSSTVWLSRRKISKLSRRFTVLTRDKGLGFRRDYLFGSLNK